MQSRIDLPRQMTSDGRCWIVLQVVVRLLLQVAIVRQDSGHVTHKPGVYARAE